jgi:hypothetical protein
LIQQALLFTCFGTLYATLIKQAIGADKELNRRRDGKFGKGKDN